MAARGADRAVYGLSSARPLRPVSGRRYRTLCKSRARRLLTDRPHVQVVTRSGAVGHRGGRAAARDASAVLALARVVVGLYRIRGERPFALEPVGSRAHRGRRGGLARISTALSPSASHTFDRQSDCWSGLGHLASAEFLNTELPASWAATVGLRVDDARFLSIVYVALPQDGR